MKVKSGLILILVVVLIGLTGGVAYFGIGENHFLGAQNIRQGLDLKGGVNIVYEADKENPTDEEMSAAIEMIQGRLDRGNYTEAEVAREGSRRIRVDIPGVEDPNKAIEDIGATAQLQFISPEGEVILTGNEVKDARREVVNDNGITKAVVALEFNSKGKEAFAEATEKYLGQMIMIALDDTIISAPTVNAVITEGNAIIDGVGTVEEADELAARIKAGALPFKLTPLQSNSVGAKLGASALESSLKAGFIGIILVLIFMLVVYRVPGLAADLALIFYCGAVVIILSYLQSTLTLPGIAGIILSVGMAVDANVIIFARIREELSAGKTLRAALDSGFSKAFSAILDGNITTLIAAGVLYWIGTGLIKSFAQTLGIGILVSMFTSLVVTRIMLKQFVNLGLKNPKLYGAK
ncbi:protein translocase subunit SecD [Defluviitalea raffinosedens]|uniref:protein translocase subunit SecD n=1 Tax=Defluviitalea raffinosedens TaxID=1450156 RepID=UPI00175FE4A2|nr:protein translocase subunit SecD [Defluviitalea raffinosedens]MBM7684770.1 protein-export SecD/SecF family membrane protein [Defluviitalea raffinosedens]MBZ4669144.1 protein-export rane protein SecD [Defluviitaleaceae bacterium]HHW67000.1 protein translocase subunit SecD [Candidatus Epulonipiscium sp.]